MSEKPTLKEYTRECWDMGKGFFSDEGKLFSVFWFAMWGVVLFQLLTLGTMLWLYYYYRYESFIVVSVLLIVITFFSVKRALLLEKNRRDQKVDVVYEMMK